jgi:hypothetical protein
LLELDDVARDILKIGGRGSARTWLGREKVEPVEYVRAGVGRDRPLYDPENVRRALRAWVSEMRGTPAEWSPAERARAYANRYDRRTGGTVMNGRLAHIIATDPVGRPGQDRVVVDRIRELLEAGEMMQKEIAHVVSEEFGVAVSRDQIKRQKSAMRRAV